MSQKLKNCSNNTVSAVALTLVTDAGEEILRPGDCAAFKAGDPDGHHLVNRSDRPAKVLEIGNSDPRDRCVYSDIDMVAGPGTARSDSACRSR